MTVTGALRIVIVSGALLALALLGTPAIVLAQQQSPMQGQAPAADTSKPMRAANGAKKGAKKSGAKKRDGEPITQRPPKPPPKPPRPDSAHQQQ